MSGRVISLVAFLPLCITAVYALELRLNDWEIWAIWGSAVWLGLIENANR